MWSSRSPMMTAGLLLLASLALFSTSSSPSLCAAGVCGGVGKVVLFAEASKQQPKCAQLAELFNYGVNRNLIASANYTYYLDSQYFCANTAPVQYHCKCSTSTTCRRKDDPWGRNIGVCQCCPSWMIACLVLLCLFFLIGIFCGVYVLTCEGRWWCDGYVPPSTALMPRRGPAVACPPSRPLPDNLFRGYASADFVNAPLPSLEHDTAQPPDPRSIAAAAAERHNPSPFAAAGEQSNSVHSSEEQEEQSVTIQRRLE